MLLRPFYEDTACRVFKEFPDGLLLIILRKGREADKAFLLFSTDGDVLAALDLIAGFLQHFQKILKVLRAGLSLQDPVNIPADLFSDRFLLRVDGPFLPFPVRLRLDHRQAVLQADHVAEPLQRQAGQMEILELPGPVQSRRIENDVVVNMRPVRMRGHNEGVPSFGKTHGQLIADPVGILRRNLTGFEGLPDLVGDHISPAAPGR